MFTFLGGGEGSLFDPWAHQFGKTGGQLQGSSCLCFPALDWQMCTNVYRCVTMHNSVCQCAPLYAIVYQCVLMCANVYQCVPLCTIVCHCVPMCTNVNTRDLNSSPHVGVASASPTEPSAQSHTWVKISITLQFLHSNDYKNSTWEWHQALVPALTIAAVASACSGSRQLSLENTSLGGLVRATGTCKGLSNLCNLPKTPSLLWEFLDFPLIARISPTVKSSVALNECPLWPGYIFLHIHVPCFTPNPNCKSAKGCWSWQDYTVDAQMRERHFRPGREGANKRLPTITTILHSILKSALPN